MSKYGSLRKHQVRALKVAEEIIDGRRKQKVVVAGVTPGGGKTLMASIFANELGDAGFIEQVIVVVPNDSLGEQMKQGFHDRDRGLHRFLVESTRQGTIPGTGIPFGKVVTYQSLSSERTSKRHAKWAAKRRTLVIFDECHHLLKEKSWEIGARRLVDAAKLVLCMSGTLWRWDEEPIPFIPYNENNVAIVDIRYSRPEALSEQAVLPVEFKFFDGEAVYERHNVPHETRLSRASKKEQSDALRTALGSAEYTQKFLTEALRDWERYRRQGYQSQLIVCCHSQQAAKAAHKFVRHHFGVHNPVLSVCSESNADKAIRAFRSGQAGILTTVRKAYEGLDVRGATHLVYLGNVRSYPFLDQVIARITRFNPDAPLKWEEQRGYVYAPDDPAMRQYVNTMHEEQLEYFREKDPGGLPGSPRKRSTFHPMGADVVGVNFGLDGRCLTPEENEAIRELAKLYPQMQLPLTDKLDLARRLGLISMPPGPSPEPNGGPHATA